jgi:LysM repeat protein
MAQLTPQQAAQISQTLSNISSTVQGISSSLSKMSPSQVSQVAPSLSSALSQATQTLSQSSSFIPSSSSSSSQSPSPSQSQSPSPSYSPVSIPTNTITIPPGSNLTKLAQQYGTTVADILAVNPQITDPNKIIAGAQLKIPLASPLKKTTQPTPSDLSLGKTQFPVIGYDLSRPDQSLQAMDSIMRQSNYFSDWINYYSKLYQNITKQVEEEKAQEKSWLEKMISGPEKTREQRLEELRAQYNIPERLSLLEQQNIKVAQLKAQMDKLDIDRQVEIDRAFARPTSMPDIRAEANEINRLYDSKKAYLAAQLAAEVALAQAYQGNLQAAQSLIQDSIEAFTFDYQERRRRYEILFNYYQDEVKNLKQEQRDILNKAYQESVRQEENVREDAKYKLQLWVDAAKQGVYLNYPDLLRMSNEEATRIYAEKIVAQQQIIGGTDRGIATEKVATPTIYGLTPTQARDVLFSPNPPEWFASAISQQLRATPSQSYLNQQWEDYKKRVIETHQQVKNKIVEQEKPAAWEIDGLIWEWLATEGANLSDEEKKIQIMKMHRNPANFGIY